MIKIKHALTIALATIWAALVFFAWKKRAALLGLLPIPESFPLYPAVQLACYALLLLLGVVGLLALVQFARTPILLKSRWRRTVECAGLWNAQRETPELLSVRPDPNKAHGLIFKVDGKGLSPADFGRRVDRLEAGLGGQVYALEYGRKSSRVLVYLLPQKHIRPTIISPADKAIGCLGVEQLINMLVIGATGTGKTVALKILMSKITKIPNAKIWLLDFKQFDFRAFAGAHHYYGYMGCVQGLNDFYEAFKRQQEAGEAAGPNYLIIDEWGAFIMALEKKEAEQLKRKLAELLMLGRAYQFFPIVGVQRPDAAYFASARDNFQTCLALGNLSPEGRRMVFPDSVASQITECKKREGHLYIDGGVMEKIRIEEVSDMAALDSAILEGLNR